MRGVTMNFISKKFLELSTKELYEILKSRTEIFLLEQRIICQDLDNKDYDCLHCFFVENERVIAYLRACGSGEGVVTIGRVLTLEHKKGLGSELMRKSIDAIKEQFDCKRIIVHAQKQAVGFYEKMGFLKVSHEFLEEGIPHLTMEMKI